MTLYEKNEAAGLACFRDSLADCNPETCAEWLAFDKRRGVCGLLRKNMRKGTTA